MKFKFPRIEHISDVLPAIEGSEHFIVAKKDGYSVINYVVMADSTFPELRRTDIDESHDLRNILKRECRGIAFDDTGKIISRPFHKFFNFGERDETRDITQLMAPHRILQKLDGSMIRPLYFGKYFRLGTKMGITDIAMMAEEFISTHPQYTKFINECDAGTGQWTPIFEFCSRKNQIIMDYPEDKLVLLAIRDTITGEYMSYETMQDLSADFHIPLVDHKSFDGDIEKFIADTRQEEDNEGYVIVLDNGHRVKIKSDWYVLLHKSKELVGREKDLVKLILTGGLDDIKGLLVEADLKEVERFERAVTSGVVAMSKIMDKIYSMAIDSLVEKDNRKEFALRLKESVEKNFHPFLFRMHDGKKSLELINEYVVNSCSSNTKLEAARWAMLNARFKDSNLEKVEDAA